jgi:hypothetical protein
MGKKQVFIKTGANRALLEKLLAPYSVEINKDYEDFGYTVLEYPEEDFEHQFKTTMWFLHDCGIWLTAINVLVHLPEVEEFHPFSNYSDFWRSFEYQEM